MTGVTYTDVLNGEEFEQPAGIVLLTAYAINNGHLMLLSGIGQTYDPVAQTGVIGKNYCYRTGAGANLFFEGRYFNPFMNAGGSNSFSWIARRVTRQSAAQTAWALACSAYSRARRASWLISAIRRR